MSGLHQIHGDQHSTPTSMSFHMACNVILVSVEYCDRDRKKPNDGVTAVEDPISL